jgi:hypothetical protein
MISVSRAINCISINGDEYLLNDDGDVVLFETLEHAQNFLTINNITESEIQTYNFHNEDENQPDW